MITSAELREFATWAASNLPVGPRRSAVIHFFRYAEDVLTSTRMQFAQASSSGQLQRLAPPSRATMVSTTVADVDALLEGMTGLVSEPSQQTQDFGVWAVPMVPAGPRRTQLLTILSQVGILEHEIRRWFIAGSVMAQQGRALPPSRAQMVTDAMADAVDLLAGFQGLPLAGKPED